MDWAQESFQLFQRCKEVGKVINVLTQVLFCLANYKTHKKIPNYSVVGYMYSSFPDCFYWGSLQCQKSKRLTIILDTTFRVGLFKHLFTHLVSQLLLSGSSNQNLMFA